MNGSYDRANKGTSRTRSFSFHMLPIYLKWLKNINIHASSFRGATLQVLNF